jgi:hypothetical protein
MRNGFGGDYHLVGGGPEVVGTTVLHNASAYMITPPDVRRERTVSNDCSVK